MIVQMVPDLEKRMKKIQYKKCLPKPRRTKGQLEMNNTLEGINSRITEAEEWINDLEDRMVGNTAVKKNIENRMGEKRRRRRQPESSGITLNTPTFA